MVQDAGMGLGADVEIRTGFPAEHGAHVTNTFIGHRLALDVGLAAVVKRFSRGHRSSIAKAVREGVTVERRTDTDALRRFYRLHVATRRRLGLPTPPKRFILGFARLFDAGLGFVMLARQHGRDTAAAVFLATGGTLFYEAGASDARFLDARPNNLLFSEAVRTRTTPDFFGSRSPGELM
jgi:lipid II:glycine glycyltransferase (peptidoglycan interpeptide bridge formation enzyme)